MPDSSFLMIAPNGRTNSHHIAPKSRWKGVRFPRQVLLPVDWHDTWHALFFTMTPYEACFLVEELFTVRTRKGWTWPMICELRMQIIRHVEEKRKRRGPRIDPLAIFQTRRNRVLSFDHLPVRYWEKHRFLFGDLETVGQLHVFVARIMVPGKKFTGAGICVAQEHVIRSRGLRLVT